MTENLKETIDAEMFFSVDMRAGTVVDVQPFPEARKPAFKVWVDFSGDIGVRKTSAQVTVHYTPETLLGRRVLGWVNAPVRQIGPFRSEFLLLGVHDADGHVRLLQVDGPVPAGGMVC